jgi:hypothetical protein
MSAISVATPSTVVNVVAPSISPAVVAVVSLTGLPAPVRGCEKETRENNENYNIESATRLATRTQCQNEFKKSNRRKQLRDDPLTHGIVIFGPIIGNFFSCANPDSEE